MNVLPIPAFSDNYIWAIIDKEQEVFDCVDPGEAAPVLTFAKQHHLRLNNILVTHHHQDHIGGVKQLLDVYPESTVYGPVDSRIPYITSRVRGKDVVQSLNCSFQILFNPGHTSTHISYYEPKQRWLFCGDTLFSAGCGRVFDGTMEELHQSLLLFKELPTETLVFCAHEYTRDNLNFAHSVEPHNQNINLYLQKLQATPSSCSLPSTLADELGMNPFLRTQVTEVIDYALLHGALSSASIDVFATLRHQKNIF